MVAITSPIHPEREPFRRTVEGLIGRANDYGILNFGQFNYLSG